MATLTGEFEGSIRVFDRIELQALKMADVITEGIARQFPLRFL